MQDHLANKLSAGFVYSCPRSVFSAQSLHSRLDMPSTKRARMSRETCANEEELHCEEDGELGSRVFFKLVPSDLGKKKTLRLPIGCGGRVEKGIPLITLHARVDGGEEVDDVAIISSQPMRGGSSADITYLLQGWSCSNEVAMEEFLQHRESGACWTLSQVLPPAGFSQYQVCNLVTKLMLAGSQVHCLEKEQRIGSVLVGSDQELAVHLASQGYLEARPNGRWFCLSLLSDP